MKNDRLGANVLSMKVIPNVDPALAKELSLKPEHRSLGIVTSDCDDVTYVALDEATKAIPYDHLDFGFWCRIFPNDFTIFFIKLTTIIWTC